MAGEIPASKLKAKDLLFLAAVQSGVTQIHHPRTAAKLRMMLRRALGKRSRGK